MLFSNVKVSAQERKMDFGVIFQIALGESGRGRKLLALTCPQGCEVKAGANPGYTIGITRSGKPRIVAVRDSDLYLLLSAEGGYTRRGNGTIQVLAAHKEEFAVLARGNGADGDAGRIGFWDCLLLKAPKNGIVRVRTSGAGYGTPSDLYVILDGSVYHCTVDDIESLCESIGIEPPCHLYYKDGSLHLVSDEWAVL